MAFHEERRRVWLRLSVLHYLTVVLFLMLAMNFWYLQVVQHDRFEEMRFDPAALGLSRPADGALAGGGPAENAAALRAAIGGEPGPVRDPSSTVTCWRLGRGKPRP